MGALTAYEPVPIGPGVKAAHWCMHWRDTGEHNYKVGFKGKLRCTGCGTEKKK